MESTVYTIIKTDNGYPLNCFYRFKEFEKGDMHVFELKSLGDADDDSITVHGKENADIVRRQLSSMY